MHRSQVRSTPSLARPDGGAAGAATHRLDIQGLRAVAVLLVVLAHAGVGFLAGGFVGVDVFFVLSGFLITSLLLAEARAHGSVSLIDFYVRRARRILPAAALTLLVTNVAALFLLSFVPNRFTALRQSAIETCNASTLNAGCTLPTGFTRVYTRPADAFPAGTPRPVAPELLIRSFDIPATTATHVPLVVLTNQCTGNGSYQGEQDNDPANDTDCRLGSTPYGVATPELPAVGAVALGRAPQQGNVRVAELQVFGRQSSAK